MEQTLYCLVDPDGRAYVKDDAGSYAEVAAEYALDERECHAYRFDLETRQLVADRATQSSAPAAQACVAGYVGTPEQLMRFAAQGHVPKQVLASLLSPEIRQAYLRACAGVEKHYTEACTSKSDPCLASGCSLEGEICLEPLLIAGIEYRQACAAEWLRVFETPTNRIAVWKN